MMISFPTALGLLLIALKLCGVITFGWVWVLLPLWIGIAIWGLFFAFALMCAFIRGK